MAGSPHAKLLEELTAVMIKGDGETLEKFISEKFSPQFRDAVPLTERLPRLKRIGSRFKDASVEKLVYDGEKTDIHFKTPEGMLIFGVLVTDGKISGIMLQD